MKTYFSLFPKHTRAFWGGLVLATIAALLLTACEVRTTTSSTQTFTVTPAPAATATLTETPTAATAAVIKTGTATTKSGPKTVLTNAHGLTLYYFDPDTATTSACTGGCAQAWPPLLFSGPGQPTVEGSLSGQFQLAVVKTANGMQVAYNGHLLYTYADDKAAGTAEGDGELGKWHVATPDVKPL